jgi:hypothetical protein
MPPVYVPPPIVRKPRPPLVTLACYLLAGVVALRLVSAVAAFFAVPEFAWHYSEQLGDDQLGPAAAFGIVGLGLSSVLIAIVYLALTLLTGSGLNWARVLTWITTGLTALVTLISSGPGDVAWYAEWTTVIAWLAVVFAVAAAVLLALPAAHPFYRRVRPVPPPMWYPPPPGPGWYGPPPGPATPPRQPGGANT